KIASIVNVVGSSIDRESDVSLYLNCGPEIAVASTKAFSAQLSVFYLLAYALSGKPDEGVQHLRSVSELLPTYLERWQVQTKALAQRLAASDHVYYLARGVGFPIALEGALKMKEISYAHAEGMPAGELKHGALALITEGTPVVLINPNDYTFSDTLSNGLETRARGARLIGISDVNNEAYDDWIPLPKTDPLFFPFLANFPLQLLAYHASVLRGNDPDKPRNLAKSVTVR
ncbi:MAG TPA: SIS domain-containing protein, partial [Candidatus Norongarragalinales archaeon]|nr:SIS domain-containing protein [Candidatus Norongarragalinales archaeon]